MNLLNKLILCSPEAGIIKLLFNLLNKFSIEIYRKKGTLKESPKQQNCKCCRLGLNIHSFDIICILNIKAHSVFAFRHLGISYTLATTGAVGTALTINKLVKVMFIYFIPLVYNSDSEREIFLYNLCN